VVAAATGTYYGQAMTAGDIYTVAGNGTAGLSGNGGPATRAQLDYPAATLRDSAGNLLIADYRNGRIRVVAAVTGTYYGKAMTAGHIYTAVGGGTHGLGDGGPATHAQLGYPDMMALDSAGNLLIADAGDGRIRLVAAATGTYYGKAMTAGHIYTVAGGGTHGLGNGRMATQAKLRFPTGIAVDSAGNLVIADFDGNRIRVVAASTGTFYGKAMTAEHIYTVAGNGTGKFSGDGGPATQAELWAPDGVAVDSAGNLLIADLNNNRVRLIAASTGTYYGQAMTASDIYTVAGDGTWGFSGDGGPATQAALRGPRAVTVDSAGNLLIADSYNSVIRVVVASTGTYYGQAMTAGDIYTVAGNGNGGFSGDGGPATHAELSQPWGVTVDNAGSLLIADTANGRIREVAG
jgi:secreted PhoX family phosphatase